MEITDVKITICYGNDSKLKAFANIVFDNCFMVRGIKIIDGNKGYFVAMPSRKTADNKNADVAHPVNNETRIMIENAILDKYEMELNR